MKTSAFSRTSTRIASKQKSGSGDDITGLHVCNGSYALSMCDGINNEIRGSIHCSNSEERCSNDNAPKDIQNEGIFMKSRLDRVRLHDSQGRGDEGTRGKRGKRRTRGTGGTRGDQEEHDRVSMYLPLAKRLLVMSRVARLRRMGEWGKRGNLIVSSISYNIGR